MGRCASAPDGGRITASPRNARNKAKLLPKKADLIIRSIFLFLLHSGRWCPAKARIVKLELIYYHMLKGLSRRKATAGETEEFRWTNAMDAALASYNFKGNWSPITLSGPISRIS